MKTIEVPEGFHLELVASEPMVEEPASFVFDGNGAMYVCEWRTYMQDEHASGAKDRVSRVVKLVDTDGDGKMDRRTVFIDNVLLPRTVLPLHDRVLVNFTDENSVWSYFDDDEDGVADRREIAYEGDANKGNIEHQSTGLMWNLDNRIDTNYARLKYEDGQLSSSPHSESRISQWGIARDDDGRIYGTWAGGANPAHSFQFPAGYPIVSINEHGPDYQTPYSICETEDQSSGGYDVGNKRVLTNFSASSGQTMIRSGIMGPYEGLMTTCEPVGRFIRGSRFDWSSGKGVAYNVTPGAEFIRSTDTYFRPVWSESGPDGTLYFADMYRGIIQEKNWFPTEGNHPWVKRYHRVRDWGMLDVTRHGRIYRLVPDDVKVFEQPRMLDQSGEELVAYLDHHNGWWRDQAQMQIVLRGGETAVFALKKMVWVGKSDNARINALWTLEGLGKLNRKLVLGALEHRSNRVRMTGVRLSEPWLKEGDPAFSKAIDNHLAEEKTDPQLVIQIYNSLGRLGTRQSRELQELIFKSNGDHPIFVGLADAENEKKQLAALGASSKRGQVVYKSICVTCHGDRGLGIYEGDTLLAPPLAESPLFMQGSEQAPLVARILINGMTGPLRGRHYGEGVMIPFGQTYSDQQLADVINYIGYKWNRRSWGEPVGKETIVGAREAMVERLGMWTDDELREEAEKLGLSYTFKKRGD
ncbi:MAG: c-type cytochrome [Opitutales bacterium]|nr:c-type cytochrome [Opitutales bacterium]